MGSIFDLPLSAHLRQTPITIAFFTVLSQFSGFHETWGQSLLYGAVFAIGMHAVVYGIGQVMRRF